VIIVKNRSRSGWWAVYHKGSNSMPEDYYAQLKHKDAFSFIFGTSPPHHSVIGVKNFK
jgi:hypothetical protein